MGDEPRGVLVVEDDKEVGALLALVLSEAGYAVRQASDATQGLAMLSRWRPDAIVLDIELPDADGWEFRRAQRALAGAATIPVVVVSAGHRVVAPSPELIPAAVIPKPFDINHLVAVVARLVAPRPPIRRRAATLA